MNRIVSLEQHICRCGNVMEYDGLETSILSDIDEDGRVLSDMSVFTCNSCNFKIWVHETEHCESLSGLK